MQKKCRKIKRNHFIEKIKNAINLSVYKVYSIYTIKAENRTRTDDPFITSDNVTANDNKLYKILVYFAIVKNTKIFSTMLKNAVFLREKCRNSLILRFVHFHNDLQKFCIFKTQVQKKCRKTVEKCRNSTIIYHMQKIVKNRVEENQISTTL